MSHVVWNHCRERACWVKTESFAKSWTSYVTEGDLMFKEDTPPIHPEAVFNEDNNNNKKLYL